MRNLSSENPESSSELVILSLSVDPALTVPFDSHMLNISHMLPVYLHVCTYVRMFLLLHIFCGRWRVRDYWKITVPQSTSKE